MPLSTAGPRPSRRRTILRAGLVGVLAILALPPAAFAYNDGFRGIVERFRSDTGRLDPTAMISQYIRQIRAITGMEVLITPRIDSGTRQAADDAMFAHLVRRGFTGARTDIPGSEYLLRHLGVIGDRPLRDQLHESLLAGVDGLYIPSTKRIMLVEGAGRHRTQLVIEGELLHAAQDSSVRTEPTIERHALDVDSTLALDALFEGQAQAYQLVRTLGENATTDERLHLLSTKLPELRVAAMKETGGGFLAQIDRFPRDWGLVHVAARAVASHSLDFKAMFDTIPETTDQVINADRFSPPRQPERTQLEINAKKILRSIGGERRFESTLGAAYLLALFNHYFPNEGDENLTAVVGWNGDHALMLRKDGLPLLAIDSLWATDKDAREFADRYRALLQARPEPAATEEIRARGGAPLRLRPDIRQSQRRVLIVESWEGVPERAKVLRFLGFSDE